MSHFHRNRLEHTEHWSLERECSTPRPETVVVDAGAGSLGKFTFHASAPDGLCRVNNIELLPYRYPEASAHVLLALAEQRTRNVGGTALEVMAPAHYGRLWEALWAREYASYQSVVAGDCDTPFRLNLEKGPASIAADVDKLAPRKGRLLDVGCELGVESIELARRGHQVTAIDADPAVLPVVDHVRSAFGLPMEVLAGDFRTLEPSQYDTILASQVLHFLESEEVPPAIELLKNQTKPGGLNLITVWNTANRSGDSRPHLFAEGELTWHYRDWKIHRNKLQSGHLGQRILEFAAYKP